jgi:hypothetical protein
VILFYEKENIMPCFSIVCVAALGGLLYFAGLELARPAQAHDPDPCDGLRELGLFVYGEPVDEYIARIGGIREGARAVDTLIGQLEITAGRERLTQILIQLDDDPQAEIDNLPEALEGIAGFITTSLLKKLLPRTPESPDVPIADEVVYGRIRDHTFVRTTMSGHLSVDICTDRKEFVPIGGADLRKFFHWDIEIPIGVYSVSTRVGPSDPSDPGEYNNPFPSVNLALPAQAVDPSDPRSIWRRGLDHKLHAEGERITVRSVYYRKLSEPDLVLISNRKFYEPRVESCVDLFTVGYPPATFGELAGNDYCLGRCAFPAIYNSGD